MSRLQLVWPQPPAPANDSGCPADASASDPLIGFAGSVAGLHALVIEPNGVDFLCSLVQHGCAAATSLRLAERSAHQEYDVVFAPSIVSVASVRRIICQAQRALVPTGRFLAYVPATAANYDEVAALLVSVLQRSGFIAVQAKSSDHGLLVRGDVAMHGISAGLPGLTRWHA